MGGNSSHIQPKFIINNNIVINALESFGILKIWSIFYGSKDIAIISVKESFKMHKEINTRVNRGAQAMRRHREGHAEFNDNFAQSETLYRVHSFG